MEALLQDSNLVPLSSLVNFNDIGVVCFPSEWNRLNAVKTSHLKVPKYQGDIWHIVKVLGYIAFRRDMDDLNPGIVISRPEMEAAWLRLLLKKYKNYNPAQRAREEGFEEFHVLPKLLWWKQCKKFK